MKNLMTKLTRQKQLKRRPTPLAKPPGAPYSFKGLVKKVKADPGYGHELHKLIVYARINWASDPAEYDWANCEIHIHIKYPSHDSTAVQDVGLNGDLDDGDTRGKACTNNTTFMHLDFLKYI